MEAVSISEKQAAEAAEVDLEEQVKRTDEQLDMMSWKMDNVEKQLEVPGAPEEAVIHLMKSVTEVRQDYHQLRRELVEVQALQRELSGRLRTQLRLVHTKFARLRQRLVEATPPH
ncbi:hypothetical protein JYU34_011691 [Plutella xylostella]|uniref:Ska2 N-terminal domain-containing protein n=1 Tax=Plutella xylostella TaxID=51655 RepID=A0ABQ7QDE5_PLUXY|nr:uncharacterized protein LOC105384433 isoform X1 [Plutella xylostella]KAG7303226.1 hypothetical protein JYU34_011691 [Plutella xylostella]